MVNNINIERVYENTFLGVIVDHKTSYKIRAIERTLQFWENKAHSGSQNMYS